MAQKLITMSETEILRYDIIRKLLDKKLKNSQAAKLLDLSVRQIKRLKKKVKEKGEEGLIHKNRGRESNRKIKKETAEKIIKIIKNRYSDFGPTLAREKLKENQKIEIGKETLRQIMIEKKLWIPKPRKETAEYRSWRERKECYGEMEQFDGSYHLWFEGRASECCLLLSIDDATGNITYAKFDENEGSVAVFKFWLEYFAKNGLPSSIYLDKFSTYKINHSSAIDNKELMTQFQRAMGQIGVKPITAHSPEAKGRVEKLFKTLQDRLIKELRLNNISTIAEANRFLEEEFLPKFNAKFMVESRAKTNLHKELTKKEKDNLDSIFSRQYERAVRNDFTIDHKKHCYQLEETQSVAVYKSDKVIVEERTDKSIQFKLRGKYLNYKPLPEKPKKINAIKSQWVLAQGSSYKPSINHPWRKTFKAEYLKKLTKNIQVGHF